MDTGKDRGFSLLGHEIRARGKPKPAGSHFFSHAEGPESKANPEESEERQNPGNTIETQDPPMPEASTPLDFPATPANILPFGSSCFELSFCHLYH